MKKMMSWKWTHNQFNFYWNNECSEGVKKRKHYVKYSSIYKIKEIERFIFTWKIANKRLYTKQKFWNFARRLIWMPRIKKNCHIWSNKSESKIIFLMNCWRCPRWLKTRRKTLTKNWQYSWKQNMNFDQWIFFGFIFDWPEWHFWRSVFVVDSLFSSHYKKKWLKL